MPASSNYEYWREREETQRQHNIEDLAEFNARLNAIYLQMIESATREIEAFYGRYAEAEGITVAEAKARVAKLEIEEYARKAAEYVRTHDLSDRANEEMRLYNATMKINRLELLKANIGLYMCGGFSEIEKEMGIRLDDATKAEFARLAGILGRTINNADKRSDSLVNASFQNATFSDRIWMYQDSLKDTLGGLLMSGMIQGKSPAELARGLRREFDVSRHQAERLMRTELCRVQTEAQKLSYQRNGYTKYIYLALGANPCDDCLDNDGKVFKVDEMSIAVNAPPMHPNCMCSTAPYFEEKAEKAVGFEENQMARNREYSGERWQKNGKRISESDFKRINDFAKSKGIVLEQNVRGFDGDPDLLIDFIDNLSKAAEQFPKINSGKTAMHVGVEYDQPDDCYAITRGNKVSVNGFAFRSVELLLQDYAASEKTHWFVKGSDYHYIGIHESAHVITNVYQLKTANLLKDLFGERANKLDIDQYIIEHVSEYATDKPKELIAECYVAYKLGSDDDFVLKVLRYCGII